MITPGKHIVKVYFGSLGFNFFVLREYLPKLVVSHYIGIVVAQVMQLIFNEGYLVSDGALHIFVGRKADRRN
jgi:hypothetical protein